MMESIILMFLIVKSDFSNINECHWKCKVVIINDFWGIFPVSKFKEPVNPWLFKQLFMARAWAGAWEIGF